MPASPSATHHKPITVMRVIARMNVGGPALLESIIIRAMNDAEFQTLLVCGQVEPGEIDFITLRDPDLPVIRLRSMSRSVKGISDIITLWRLWRLMRQHQPDIVHTHTAKAGLLGRLAAILARVPIRVHTFHGHVLHGYFSPVVTRGVIFLERLLATRTTAIVAVGAQVRNELLAAGIGRSEQYLVVAPGVPEPPEISQEQARAALRLPADVPVIGFVGRLTHIKRPDRLLEAFTLVHEQRPDAVLVIAGEGDLYTDTQALAAPLGDSVRFLGWVADLHNLYAAADLVILTSDNEGMPVSLIEASMAGLPCVTTDVGSAREVVAHEVTGMVVTHDAAALAAAVSDLLRRPNIASEMGRAAQQHAREHFSTERLIDDHQMLYRRLMSARA
jgi:glycosyltransferase involved in cell wall biosynthesis